MSGYYRAPRTKNLYDPSSVKPFKISRSKIDLFISCPRCFYLDRRLGVGQPPGFPFNLNNAVDTLLKKEFDRHRKNKEKHPIIRAYGVDAIPVDHEELDTWRQNFKGIQYLHEPTNLMVFGAIDDLWQDSLDRYIVVDYKATSKKERITALDQAWQDSYKRQMEIYQWLLRRNGYEVSPTGYFIYCNGHTDREAFDGKLDFELTLIAYEGDDGWVEQTVRAAHACLNQDRIPAANKYCDYCTYVDAASALLRD